MTLAEPTDRRAVETSGTILEVERLTRSFDGLLAVNDCSLTVQRGTITGLIGPNGAGKTTLFNLVTGFLSPTSGRIDFQGQQIDTLGPHAIFRLGLVRTFQIPRALAAMTVLENLMLVPQRQFGEWLWASWLLPGRVKRQEYEIVDKAMSVLEYVDLVHLRDEYAANLSGGQKKLLELARTLMADPTERLPRPVTFLNNHQSLEAASTPRRRLASDQLLRRTLGRPLNLLLARAALLRN